MNKGVEVGVVVLVVLLLVIMPALLYLIGWAATRYTREAPSWIGFPMRPDERATKSGDETAARVGE